MILTIGTSLALARSMTFDRLTLGEVNRAAEVLVAAAGKSSNVARVVATLGEATLATGVVGGLAGQALAEELTRAGVPHDYVSSTVDTRVCVTVLDRATGAATELVQEPSEMPSVDSDRLWEKLLALVPQARVAVMSGTLAPGVPGGFYAMVCRLARDAGVDALVDAHGPALLATLSAGPWMVKPNRVELSATLGRPVDSDETLRRSMASLVDQGARGVAVTLGAEGAAMTPDGRTYLRAEAPRVRVVSPIGSGDAFAAGLAVARRRGLPPEDSLRLAVACGTANALTARAGFVSPEDVDRLQAQVVVTRF